MIFFQAPSEDQWDDLGEKIINGIGAVTKYIKDKFGKKSCEGKEVCGFKNSVCNRVDRSLIIAQPDLSDIVTVRYWASLSLAFSLPGVQMWS